MMYTYTLVDKDDLHDPLSFISEDDLNAYQKAFHGNWVVYKSKHITHLNAQKYIDWNDIPKHLSFIYRDHAGVWASQYKPISKWYMRAAGQVYRLYGGERKLLKYKNYHELIALGDIFENPNNNRHFINWNKVKGAYAIKFLDIKDQVIEIFADDGSLLVSGNNDELKVIYKKGSFQFEKFPWQTYTFIKE